MKFVKYSLFPTLVLFFPQFINSKECEKILKLLESKKRSDHLTLIKGKSSHNESYDILSETSIDLTNAIQEYSNQSSFELQNKVTNSWFNIQEKDSVLIEHSHPNSIISGAIFINVEPQSSKICFHNPNPLIYYTQKKDKVNEYTHEVVSFQPEIGDLILFPSWIRHGSNHTKNLSDKRVVISFNTL